MTRNKNIKSNPTKPIRQMIIALSDTIIIQYNINERFNQFQFCHSVIVSDAWRHKPDPVLPDYHFKDVFFFFCLVLFLNGLYLFSKIKLLNIVKRKGFHFIHKYLLCIESFECGRSIIYLLFNWKWCSLNLFTFCSRSLSRTHYWPIGWFLKSRRVSTSCIGRWECNYNIIVVIQIQKYIDNNIHDNYLLFILICSSRVESKHFVANTCSDKISWLLFFFFFVFFSTIIIIHCSSFILQLIFLISKSKLEFFVPLPCSAFNFLVFIQFILIIILLYFLLH